MGSAQFVGFPNGNDLLAMDEDSPILDDAKGTERAPALGTTGKSQELSRGMDEHTFIKP
jgi:hypothetical protein